MLSGKEASPNLSRNTFGAKRTIPDTIVTAINAGDILRKLSKTLVIMMSIPLGSLIKSYPFFIMIHENYRGDRH